MDQKVLNLLATVSAEFYALGDDENSGMVMAAVERLVDAYGLPQEALDQANAVFISLRDLSIENIPDTRLPEEVEKCFDAMSAGAKELRARAKLLTECIELLRDYWSKHNKKRE